MALRPHFGSWPPLTGLCDYTLWTHHTLWVSSGRVISSTQRSLPHNTQHHMRQTSVLGARMSGIRTHNPSKRAGADPRLRPRGHWNRQTLEILYCKYTLSSLDICPCTVNEPPLSQTQLSGPNVEAGRQTSIGSSGVGCRSPFRQ